MPSCSGTLLEMHEKRCELYRNEGAYTVRNCHYELRPKETRLEFAVSYMHLYIYLNVPTSISIGHPPRGAFRVVAR